MYNTYMNDISTPPQAGFFALIHGAGAVQEFVESRLAAVDLSLPKLAALHRLMESGGSMPLGQLAERLACVKSNVTQLVDRLEADGLVDRAPDPNDRRSRLAVITLKGKQAFEEAGISPREVGHLMIYDAFAHLPLFGLEDLGFVERGEAARFIRDRHTAPGGRLPLNTNGGGLSYMHSGMYGMYALQESVRQLRGIAPAQVPGVRISVAHGVGGMFAASGTIVLGSER